MKQNHASEKLQNLRNKMSLHGIDGLIVPQSDAYQGEYIPARDQRLAWLTGFTGSAGGAVIFMDDAMVLSDGRYTIQLQNQVDSSLYQTGDSISLKATGYIRQYYQGTLLKIGFDPALMTIHAIEQLSQDLEGIAQMIPVQQNLIDAIWHDQPDAPCAPVSLYPDAIAGRTRFEKIALIQSHLEQQGADVSVLSMPDSVCWLLNIRGGDVPHVPVVLSRAIIHSDGGVDFYVHPDKISADVRATLSNHVRLWEEDLFYPHLSHFKDQKISLDPHVTPFAVRASLDESCTILRHKDPCVQPRACKPISEQDSMRRVHQIDAVAVRGFLQWIDTAARAGQALDEIQIEQKLKSFRAHNDAYIEDSFDTIAGLGENGAIIHYRATPESNRTLQNADLLLLDSGGQYGKGDLWGTTDITRTIWLGNDTPPDEIRLHYTLVLKGHIALSLAKFPEGTTGAQLDALARHPLWQHNLDYAHGTGHGVGCYLSVHEEAASLSPRSYAPLAVGMCLSNEPGYYKTGYYGIRIENVMLVIDTGIKDDLGRRVLGFETLTHVPYDHRLIEWDLLDQSEIDFVHRTDS
jgi:Xaa-Pro aminopeptidase